MLHLHLQVTDEKCFNDYALKLHARLWLLGVLFIYTFDVF